MLPPPVFSNKSRTNVHLNRGRLILYGLPQLIDPVAIAPIEISAKFPQFSGQRLLVASDANMAATAYTDGVLDRVPGVEDALSVIDLPLRDDNYTLNQVQVSNSVWGMYSTF